MLRGSAGQLELVNVRHSKINGKSKLIANLHLLFAMVVVLKNMQSTVGEPLSIKKIFTECDNDQ